MFLFRRAQMNAFQLRDSLVKLKQESRKLVKWEKEFHKLNKKLRSEKFTTEAIEKLNQKYLRRKKPKQKVYEEKLSARAQKFAGFFKKWLQVSTKLYAFYDDLAIQASREEGDDLKKLAILLKEAETRAEGSYFGHETFAEFKKTFEHFVNQARELAIRTFRNVRRVEHGRGPRINVFRRLQGETAFSRHIKKIVNRKLIKDEQRVKAIEDGLEAELAKHELHPGFLALLEEFFKEEGIVIIELVSIKVDICELIIKHNQAHHDTMRSFWPFLEAAGKTAQLSHEEREEIMNAIKECDGVGHEAVRFVNDEYSDERAINRMLSEIMSDSESLLKHLELSAEEVSRRQNKIQSSR